MIRKNKINRSDFLRLLAKSEPVVRSYLRSLVQDYHDHSEIMQNAFITAWEKYSKFEGNENDFCKWACVIARFQILKLRQTQARDKFVLSDKVLEKISTEGVNDISSTERWVVKYIKEGILKTYEKQGSKRKWLNLEEVYKLPKPLPIPPPDHYFQTLKVNDRWKKKE